jgi:dTDP-glucose pyrophosphorylase
MNRVVILAAGRGTRMRAAAASVRLEPEQERLAAEGLKGLIPFHGHPYLDYVISSAAEAGLTEVCLVVAPGPNPIADHYRGVVTRRVRIRFAVQEAPRGSADALLAAASLLGDEPFVVINSDNYYPARTLAALGGLEGSGMAGFRRDALVRDGGIPAERIASYALVTTDDDGYLSAIVEKPEADTLRELGDTAWISMTCWRFGPSIFEACHSIAPSRRGELELPDAVMHAVQRFGERIKVVPSEEPVIDLSRREDVPGVAERLRGLSVEL